MEDRKSVVNMEDRKSGFNDGMGVGLLSGIIIVGTVIGCTTHMITSQKYNELKSDPQKLEEFYQKTRAEQKKSAEEQIKAGNNVLKVFGKTEPVKITSATRPDKNISFSLARV